MSLLKFLGSLPSRIAHVFEGVFDSLNKLWHRISPEVQEALMKGTAIVSFINNHIDQAPQFVLDLIQKEFPGLTEEHLKSALQKVSEDLKIAEGINDADLVTLVKNLQEFLGTKTGTDWEKVSSVMAQFIAIFFAPAGTKFALIATLIEYVYLNFIKKVK